jgi:hypothetical protein
MGVNLLVVGSPGLEALCDLAGQAVFFKVFQLEIAISIRILHFYYDGVVNGHAQIHAG